MSEHGFQDSQVDRTDSPITIFDAATVKDNSGIPYVIVNGTIVVKDSKVLKDVYPGQPLRYPVEKQGRFEPVKVDTWIKTYAIPVLEHDEGHAADWTKDDH